MATELAYDLLVLDLNLTRVDGIMILRHLRTRKPSMPILVLTSRNRVEDRAECLDFGGGRLYEHAIFVLGAVGKDSGTPATKPSSRGFGAQRL